MRVVVIARSDDRVCSKLKERSEGFIVLALFHEPTGGFRREVNSDHQDESGDKGRAELQSPSDGTGVFHDDVGAESEEDTGNDPQLPEHDEGTSNTSWGEFGGENGDSSVLRTNTDTHDESDGEQLLPCLGET